MSYLRVGEPGGLINATRLCSTVVDCKQSWSNDGVGEELFKINFNKL